MTTEYSRKLLRVALAQICQNIGWSSVHATPMEILTDVLERYLISLGVFTHRYAEQFGRCEPTIDDLGLAFQEMGVNLSEVSDYMKHVEQVPFAFDVPRYPAPRPNMLNFPKPNSRELYEREEHVPDYMPTMHPGWDEEVMPSENGHDESADDSRLESSQHGEKRGAGTPLDSEPASKRPRSSKTLPEEAMPSSYEMKGVLMSDRGLPVGQGRLPDPAAPPPQTPGVSVVHNPLFKTPSLPEEPPKETEVNVTAEDSGDEIDDIIQAPVRETKSEPTIDVVSKVSPAKPLPKSPKTSSSVTTPKSTSDQPKKRGRPFKNPQATPGSPAVKPAKSTEGTPSTPDKPKKKVGRPPKSPGSAAGLPPKSPGSGVKRSPGRPPKSPASMAASPARSPLSSPLSPRGKSPGRPPKSPGRGRPPSKSPGRPGRPPKNLPKSPIQEYLRTGELAVSGAVPTKAQLKMPPMQSPPRQRKQSEKSFKRTDSMQKLDFDKPAPPGVISETVEVNTITEKVSPHKPMDILKSPKASLDETIADVLKSTYDDDDEENSKDSEHDAAAKRQREREEQLRQEILRNERTAQQEKEKQEEKKAEKAESAVSGRVTPDWIRQHAEQISKEVKLKEERKAKAEECHTSTPALTPSPKPAASAAAGVESAPPATKDKERSKSKKEKKKKKHRGGGDENEGGDGSAKRSKKEKKFAERLREKLRESSLSSSSPERPVERRPSPAPATAPAAPSGDEKSAAIQPLRIGLGNKQFTIKTMPEDSDKETKKKKKSKKHKERDRDKEREKGEKHRDKGDDGKERKEKKKDKKRDKEKDKEKSRKKEESQEPSVPKLTFKLGGKGMTVTPTDSPRDSPKRDIPKLVIKSREEKRPKSPSSRSASPSPTRRYSPFHRSPSPPARDRMRISPVRFTPSPESNPKTPSMNPSPANSRVSSPSLRHSSIDRKAARSSRERSLSPIKTPTFSRHTPSPPPSHRRDRHSRSPSLTPAFKGSVSAETEEGDAAAASSKGKRGKAASGDKSGTQVISETQGTIIGEDGEIIWICPTCGKPDDGRPMIGCDTCDDWYHWECEGITEEPPDDESWFCPRHRSKDVPKRTPPKGTPRGRGRGRGRKKKM